MGHQYHKGKYRSGEWCKHLGPFLKRTGNRRWRRDARTEIAAELDETALAVAKPDTQRRSRTKIRVRFTITNGRFTHTYNRFYKTRKSAEDAVRRNAVISVSIFRTAEK